MKDLLTVSDLKVEFPTRGGLVRAVDGVSFRIRPGSTVALVGESGSGKSVTAQAILGILPRSARIVGGSILFAQEAPEKPVIAGAALPRMVDLARLDPESDAFRRIRGDRISMIFQEPMTSLSPLHTVGDQVIEALLLHRPMSRRAGHDVTIQMLRLVGFPDPALAYETYPFELSGGLRQRAMIAMALICHPSLLIADEPSTALDVTIQAQILKLIMDLQAEIGMAVLIITHDLGVVANVAEEVVVMYQGKVMESGTLDDIFHRAEHPYLKALLRAVPRFDMGDGERLTPLREIRSEAGHLLTNKPAWPSGADAAPLVEVHNVSKSFTTRKGRGLFGVGGTAAPVNAVSDVSFAIHRGECLGLVGESGCGKTTLCKILMRGLGADGGEVRYNDAGKVVDLLTLDDRQMIPFRRKIQYIFQDPFGSLNPRMTVFDIIAEPLVIHRKGDAAFRREMVQELMRLVGLDPRWLNRYPHSFSGGQRQRIGIARALALQPDFVVCDEPVSALDVSVQAQVLNLLKDLQRQLGLTYLFISHNLAVVYYMASRIMVMCAGWVVEVAPRDVLFRRPVHPYTKALIAAVPVPDPSRRLDLQGLMEGRSSQPQSWPGPFRIANGDTAPPLVDLGGGHWVRAQPRALEVAE